jgi:hypothetical protein
VYCKEIDHWKNECPHRNGQALEPNKITPGKKIGWQLKLEAQNLIDLAGIESD